LVSVTSHAQISQILSWQRRMAHLFPDESNFSLDAVRKDSAAAQLPTLTPLYFSRWPRSKSVDGAFTLCYKVNMKSINRTIAIIELLLVFPAALFMSALFLREVQPLAQTRCLVDWFSHHVVVGLDLFLVAMPLAAFVIGGAMVLRTWRSDLEFRQATLQIYTNVSRHVASLLIAAATLIAGGILALVAMHMMSE